MAALGMDGREDSLPEVLLDGQYLYGEKVPVFFGHYWLEGSPVLTAANAVCLHHSVAKGGALVAYLWSGEKNISSENLVNVEA